MSDPGDGMARVRPLNIGVVGTLDVSMDGASPVSLAYGVPGAAVTVSAGVQVWTVDSAGDGAADTTLSFELRDGDTANAYLLSDGAGNDNLLVHHTTSRPASDADTYFDELGGIQPVEATVGR